MRYTNKNRQQRRLTKRTLLALVLALVLLTSGAIFAYNQAQTENQAEDTPVEDASDINFGPPTDEEAQAGDDKKDELTANNPDENKPEDPPNEEPNTQPQESNKIKVQPIVSYIEQAATSIRANAYIPDIIQSDGTCTLTLKRQSNTATASRKSLPDAQTTLCGLIEIPLAELSPGTWSATITYSSNTHEGTSAEQEVRIN